MRNERSWVGRSIGAVLAIGALAAGVVLFAHGATPAGEEKEKERDKDRTAYLGIQIGEAVDHDEGGALVTEVIEDSPADRAGLREDDVIVRFDDHVVRGPMALTERIHARQPGDEVTLGVVRDGKRLTLPVELEGRSLGWGPEQAPRALVFGSDDLKELKELKELGRAPGAFFYEGDGADTPPFLYRWGRGRPMLGVQLVETTPELREHLGGSSGAGILVSKVLPGTPAEKAGVQVGDLVVAVGDESISNVEELVEALHDQVGKTFSLKVIRDRRPQSIEVTIPEAAEERPSGPRASCTPCPFEAPMAVAPYAPLAPVLEMPAPAPPAPPQPPRPPGWHAARQQV